MEAGDLSQKLTRINDASPCYVHCKPLSYRTGAEKANWSSAVPDNQDRDTFAQLWKGASARGAKVKLALVSTWEDSWIGRPREQYMQDGWHCWAAAVSSHRRGQRMLLIYDSDPRNMETEATFRITQLHPMQEGFARIARNGGEKQARRRTSSVHSTQVWYNQDMSNFGSNECLSNAMDWIRQMAKNGAPIQEGDERLRGFRRILSW